MSSNTAAVERCFLISPIGEEGQDVRKHADAVRNLIIRKALKEARPDGAPIELKRGDDINAQAKILPQVVDAILEWDLVIAVLAFNNPNVFYELAVSHSAGRPTILLCHTDQKVPFNLLGHRLVYYSNEDLKNAKVRSRSGGPIDLLKNAIRDTLREGKYGTPFERTDMIALNQRERSVHVHDRFSNISLAAYSNVLLESKKFIKICGTSLLEFTRADRRNYQIEPFQEQISFFDFLAYKLLQDEIEFDCVYPSPDSPYLEQSLTLKGGHVDQDHLSQLVESIQISTNRWLGLRNRLASINPQIANRFHVRQTTSSIVFSRITATENRIIVSPNFYTLGVSGGGPAIDAKADTSTYKAYIRDLEYLCRTSPDVSELNDESDANRFSEAPLTPAPPRPPTAPARVGRGRRSGRW